ALVEDHHLRCPLPHHVPDPVPPSRVPASFHSRNCEGVVVDDDNIEDVLPPLGQFCRLPPVSIPDADPVPVGAVRVDLVDPDVDGVDVATSVLPLDDRHTV